MMCRHQWQTHQWSNLNRRDDRWGKRENVHERNTLNGITKHKKVVKLNLYELYLIVYIFSSSLFSHYTLPQNTLLSLHFKLNYNNVS
jgi:hypothetical protein